MAEVKRNRVLMLIENLSFPRDRRMYLQALALRDANYRVRVICPKGDKIDRPSFEMVDGISVSRYSWREVSARWAYPIEYAWAMLCTFVLMWKVLFTDGFDIIHGANPPDLFFGLALPFRVLGKKFVFDQHDLGPEAYESKFNRRGWIHRVMRLLERCSYRTANLVVATNQSYYDLAHERGRVPHEKLCIVRSAPDLRRFHEVPPQPKLKQGFPYMAAFVGIMARQDGVDRVIRAAHYLIQVMGRRDTRFVCIGKGECWEELKALARALGIADYCLFTGYIPDADVLTYLSTADVCLAPDPPAPLNDVSTMNKILDYMACRKPIVSFDLREARRSAGDAAIYVSEDNPRAFAEAIDRLLKEPEARRRMGDIGYTRISGEVSWERSKANLLEGYSRISA